MTLHRVKNSFTVYQCEKHAESLFRPELSALMIAEFGLGPYDPDTSVSVVKYALDYYVEKFNTICRDEKSYTFYKSVMMLHEDSCILAIKYPNEQLSEELGYDFIPTYRRALKMIIEAGCDVQMESGEPINRFSTQRIEGQLDQLLFLAQSIMMCVSLYAEQSMISDVINITYKNSLYVFSRRSQYIPVFELMMQEDANHLSKAFTDTYAIEDFSIALKKAFNIDFDDVSYLITNLHESAGEWTGFQWSYLPVNLASIASVSKKDAYEFFKGLTLDKGNKMNVLDLACKPSNMNRMLYRPIIVYNVNGYNYALVGKNSFAEAIMQITTNAIPWGKAPVEWKQNQYFKSYVHRKEDIHDKWLEDILEEKLCNLEICFERNIRNLSTSMGPYAIDIEGLGEIDFLFCNHLARQLVVLECKHLLSRYDATNMRHDYDKFVKGSKNSKSFNENIAAKVDWIRSNIALVAEHFSLKFKLNINEIINYNIVGCFLINTPTIYMYSCEFRIYTLFQIDAVLAGTYMDSVIIYEDVVNERNVFAEISFPYFEKPVVMDLYFLEEL